MGLLPAEPQPGFQKVRLRAPIASGKSAESTEQRSPPVQEKVIGVSIDSDPSADLG
jgi:hypothetical protein